MAAGKTPTGKVGQRKFVTHADALLDAGAAALALLAENGTRASVVVVNVGTNDCRIGDSAVAVAQGIVLAAGARFELAVTGPVYAFSHLGTAVSVTEIVIVRPYPPV